MERLNKNYAFTLVELIIVITILAILATIGFMSFQSYTIDARDSNRLTTIGEVEKGLDLYMLKNTKLFLPENYITVYSSGLVIGYQGTFGNLQAQNIKMTSTPLDPLDNNKYTYLTNEGGTAYQVVGFFENSSNLAIGNSYISELYALNTDYSSRVVKSFGKELGVLFVNTGSDINRPLNELYNPATFTGVDVKLFTGTLSNGLNIGEIKAVFNNKTSDNVVGTGSSLDRLENIYKQKMQVLMHTCTEGWNDLGPTPIGSNGASCDSMLGISCRICEKSDDTMLIGTIVLSPTCSEGWKDNGSTIIGPYSAYCSITGGISCRICEKLDNNYIKSGMTTLIKSCPVGWKEIGSTPISGPTSVYCSTIGGSSCKICQKN